MSENPTISLDRAPSYGAEVEHVQAEREAAVEVALPSQELAVETAKAPELSEHEQLDVVNDLHNQAVVYRATGEFVQDTGVAEALANLPQDVLAECVKCAHGAVDGLDHFMGFDNFPDGVQLTPDTISAPQTQDAGFQIG